MTRIGVVESVCHCHQVRRDGNGNWRSCNGCVGKTVGDGSPSPILILLISAILLPSFVEFLVLALICRPSWLFAGLMVATASNLPSLDERLAAQEQERPTLALENSQPAKPLEITRSDDGLDERLLGPILHSQCGITLEPIYYSELFTNTRGGLSTNDATKYNALLDLAITFDFNAMKVPLPGRFFLLGQNTHGRGLTENFVGDTQTVSNIDSFDNIMQVSEYWWEFSLFDENVAVRLGKQDLNTEFLVMDLASEWVLGPPQLE